MRQEEVYDNRYAHIIKTNCLLGWLYNRSFDRWVEKKKSLLWFRKKTNFRDLFLIFTTSHETILVNRCIFTTKWSKCLVKSLQKINLNFFNLVAVRQCWTLARLRQPLSCPACLSYTHFLPQILSDRKLNRIIQFWSQLYSLGIHWKIFSLYLWMSKKFLGSFLLCSFLFFSAF